MRRKAFFLLLTGLFLLAGTAFAELSTNLQIQTVIHAKTKRIHSQTYVDQFGNAVIADAGPGGSPSRATRARITSPGWSSSPVPTR